MKKTKLYTFLAIGALMTSSCNDFLDTTPKDSLSQNTGWKSEDDVHKFLTGCYDGWESGSTILYLDCASDIGYNNFPWEGYTPLGNGTMSPTNVGANFYGFKIIRRVNTLLANIDRVKISDSSAKKDIIAQARVIRAYKYFILNWMYGGVPIIDLPETADEAKVARKTEAEIRNYIAQELDEAIADINTTPKELGRIGKGAALAIKMREALYYGDWQVAKNKAQEIIDLNQYELEANYADLFKISNKSSKEIILATQYIPNTKVLGVIGQMYNNSSGGWSSIVPTQNLVDMYEMKTGLVKSETGSGYDPTHPFANRDPRMSMTIYYPGSNFIKEDNSISIVNTLDRTITVNGKEVANPDFYNGQDNASKTGLTWGKYLNPITQYSATGIWDTEASPIVFRFAEVLLTYAEAENELNGPSDAVYSKINQVRNRVGMPDVDRNKYSSKESLRELIQRERTVEFAGEGLRRADILRWKTSDGKMLAETVLNKTLERVVGTVSNDSSIDPELRATINVNATPQDKKIEDRVFKPHFRYLPISTGNRDSNPKLTQNPGY